MRNHESKNPGKLPSSYRDPSGFVFITKNELFRQINTSFKPQYEHLMNSGLYTELVEKGYLTAHRQISPVYPLSAKAYRHIKPQRLFFVSYPYEWCFGQLKDAALLTLSIQKTALRFGMTLKDASSFNVTFNYHEPVFLDTLSFDFYKEGVPWDAYRQFCMQFLAPLALAAYTDVHLIELLKIYLDGIPLDLTVKLLPFRARLNVSLLLHLFTHSKSQKKHAESTTVKKQMLEKKAFIRIIDSLTDTVAGLSLPSIQTEWSSYYHETNYTSAAQIHKQQLVETYLRKIKPRSVWDLGCNTGRFSKISAQRHIPTIAMDNDPEVIEHLYNECKKNKSGTILPLVMDIISPTPRLGFNHEERTSLSDRGPADAVLALALVHHLAISHNLPLTKIFEYFANITSWLIIEWVPKEDSQVKRLLATRTDIFDEYRQDQFEKAGNVYFSTVAIEKIRQSRRVVYILKKKEQG